MGLENIIIESLRDDSELDTSWRLRKSFLSKNLKISDSTEYKEHLIKLSRCFANTALGQKQNYSLQVQEETRSKSLGLEVHVSGAVSEMQNESYQSSQAVVAAAAPLYYQWPSATIPYKYNTTQQDGQQNVSSSVAFSSQGQDYQSYNQGQNNQSYDNSVSFNQSSQDPAMSMSYGQSQYQSSVPYGQNQQGFPPASPYVQNTGLPCGQNQQDSAPSLLPSTYGQNQMGSFSPFTQSQPNSANSYGQNEQDPSSYDNNQQSHSMDAFSSFVHHLNPASPFDQKQIQQDAGENDRNTPSYGQNISNSGSYGQNKGDAGAYGQNDRDPGSYGQNKKGSVSYGQNKKGSASYDQHKKGSASYDQNKRGPGAYSKKFKDPGSYGQNKKDSISYGQNKRGAATYGKNNRDSSYYGQNKRDADTFGQNDGYSGSFGQNNRDSGAYGQSDGDSGSYDQNNRGSVSYSHNDRDFYGQNNRDSGSYGQGIRQSGSFDRSQQSFVSSYDQNEQRQNMADAWSNSPLRQRFLSLFGQSHQTVPQSSRTVFKYQAPTTYSVKGARKRKRKGTAVPRQQMVNTNASSVIPANKGNPNKEAPRGNEPNTSLGTVEKKLQQKGKPKQVPNPNFAEAKAVVSPSAIGGAKNKKAKSPKSSLSQDLSLALESSFKCNPIFGDIINKMEIDKVPSESGSNSNVEIEKSALRSQGGSALKKKDPKGKKDGDDEEDKLGLLLKMAECCSKISQESLGPYAVLQKCATRTKVKIRCASKIFLNLDGEKEIKCEVFALEIQLVLLFLADGTSPDEAKEKLAIAVLEKISLPHLRLVADDGGGLKLEGSSSPFAEDVAKCQTASTTTTTTTEAAMTPSTSTATEDGSSQNGCFKWKECIVHEKPVEMPPTFDSYIAWRKETHPALKKVRQLGHMYITLPFKRVSYKEEDPAGILQTLSNVSGIRLEIRENKEPDELASGKFSMVMDGEVVLFSWTTCPEDPACFVSRSILRKVCMPYFCLAKKSLLACARPFQYKDGFTLSKDHVLDRWQVNICGKQQDNLAIPVRLEDFCLFQCHQIPNLHVTLLKSAEFCDKKIVQKSHLRETGNMKDIYFLIDNSVAGGVSTKVGRSGAVKMSNVQIADGCIKGLRKCHWTIAKTRLAKHEKFVVPVDVLPELAEQQPNGQNKAEDLKSSDKEHQLLDKMESGGGGIGKTGEGVQEPSDSLPTTSNIDTTLKTATPNSWTIRRMTDLSDVNHETIVEAYYNSTFHRDMYIPCPSGSERGKIFKMAESFDMEASTRGLQRNKRVLLSKSLDARQIVTDCLCLGGKSDAYELLPPQEVVGFERGPAQYIQVETKIKAKNMAKSKAKKALKAAAINLTQSTDNEGKDNNSVSNPLLTRNKNTKKSRQESRLVGAVGKSAHKSIQCSLIDAPKLERLKPLTESTVMKEAEGDEDEGPFVPPLECGGEGGKDGLCTNGGGAGKKGSGQVRVFTNSNKKRKPTSCLESDIVGVFKKQKI